MFSCYLADSELHKKESEVNALHLTHTWNKSKNISIPKWVVELRNIINQEKCLEAKLTLKQLALTLDIHPSYLSREFPKYFNDLSFSEYIAKLRVERAITLFKKNDKSLTEIGYMLGYSDQSHFSKKFKEKTGRSPRDYRKRLLAH